MTEFTERDILLAAMDVLDHIDTYITLQEAIQNIPFEALTPENWAYLQTDASGTQALLEYFRESITKSVRMVANEEVRAEMHRVITSD